MKSWSWEREQVERERKRLRVFGNGNAIGCGVVRMGAAVTVWPVSHINNNTWPGEHTISLSLELDPVIGGEVCPLCASNAEETASCLHDTSQEVASSQPLLS